MISAKAIVVAALLSLPAGTNSFVTSPVAAPTCDSSRLCRTSLFAGPRRQRGRRPPPKKEYVPPMNENISQDTLRVTVASKEGKDEPLGILSKSEALSKAKELGGLDLILINPNSDPPVCKIVDYSKYRYMQEKKRKEKAKNSKATEIKEVKMSYKIGEHDYGVRLKSASKFIKQGNRVKATVMFRGREVQHDKLGEELLMRLAEDMAAICNMEGRPRREGRNLGAILTPRAEVVKAVNDAKRLKEKEKKRARADSLAKRKSEAEAKAAAAAAAAAAESVAVAISPEDDDINNLETSIGGVLDGIDIDDFEDDDDYDDDDVDASLDKLLGSEKVTDDLFN